MIDLDQMVDSWCLAPGSYHDLRPAPALLERQRNLAVIADKVYISPDLDSQVWEEGEHLILALHRVNQKGQWPRGIQAILGRIRHRVETVFSVLTTAFHLDKLRSRSFSGMVVRATTRILAYILSFFLAEILTPHVVERCWPGSLGCFAALVPA
jgi:ribosomal protein L31E